MTDLLSRPSAAGTTKRPSGRLAGRLPGRLTGGLLGLLGRPTGGSGGGSGEAAGRPLTVSAALAALGVAATTMLTCMAVAVIGWFLAEGGAHGQTTDALRVGADAWLVGHGAGVTASGVPLAMVPLGLSALLVVALYRAGRWAAATSEPVEDDRTVGLAATTFTGVYLVVAVVTCIVAAQDSVSPGLGRGALGALLLAGSAGTVGLAAGTGRLRGWFELVPPWIRAILQGALAATLVLVVAAALLVAVALGLGFNEAATVVSRLDLGPGDYLMLALATVAVAPNAVVFGAAYLLGPGFAVGTGTVVSPSVVVLGPVPAFPMLAALPGEGAAPQWLVGVIAVPVLAGMVGAVMAQRSYRVPAYDSAALRGFGSGFGAAVLTTVAIVLAGGPMGTGRLADLGAPAGEVLVAAVSTMSLGGLVAGLATAWWQRRRA